MIFQRSADVPALDDYTEYRSYLRSDFRYRCAYCLTHEYYFLDGDGGEIDHHRPLNPSPRGSKDFSHLVNVYDNLYWTCSKCNRSKGNRWPTDEQYAAGSRFLDPCREDHEAHWQTNSDGTIIALTETGRYTIRTVRLDRPFLNRRRAELYQDQKLLAKIEQEMERHDISAEHRRTLQEHLETVRKRIFPPHFP
jgi:5-methylcytosine-specific restriction endonuclease McrA